MFKFGISNIREADRSANNIVFLRANNLSDSLSFSGSFLRKFKTVFTFQINVYLVCGGFLSL